MSGHAVLDSVCSLSTPSSLFHCLLYTTGDGDPHTIFLKFPSSLVSWLLGWKVGWREKLLVLPAGGTFCPDGWWASLPGLLALTAWSLSSSLRGVETVSSNLFHFAAVGEGRIPAVTDLLNRITYTFLFSRSCNTLETNSFIKFPLFEIPIYNHIHISYKIEKLCTYVLQASHLSISFSIFSVFQTLKLPLTSTCPEVIMMLLVFSWCPTGSS